VVNQSNEVHEMAIVQPAPGKTVQDILAWAKKTWRPVPVPLRGGHVTNRARVDRVVEALAQPGSVCDVLFCD